jgi:peptide/nickel transport system permease protein
VLTATTLSFLGLGVQLPQPDWGSDLAAGATYLSTSWWLSTFPGLGITVTILAANFIGDSLMSALDPREGLRPVQGFRSLVLGQRRQRPWERLASGTAPSDRAAAAPAAADSRVRTEDGQ